MTAKEHMFPIPAAPETDIVTPLDAAAPAPAPAASDGDDLTLVKVRSAALLVIAVLISLAALRYASDIFVPLVMGLMLSYALTPLVNRMVRVHVPRTLAAAILLLSIIGGIGMLAYTLSDDAVDLIEGVPEMAQKVRSAIYDKHIPGQPGTMEKVQKAASEIERASDEGNRALEHGSDVTRVQIENPKVNVMDYLLPGTVGLATGAANAAVSLFVAFFLLAQGDNFRRKMVRLAGPRLSHKKLTLRAIEEINEQIQRYLLV
jgi:predicted PurR-regulated permease PerM